MFEYLLTGFPHVLAPEIVFVVVIFTSNIKVHIWGRCENT